MLALIADYGKYRKNIGGLGQLCVPMVGQPCPVRILRPPRSYSRGRGLRGLLGLGDTSAAVASSTVQYCNIPGVGLTACPGQDLSTIQCVTNLQQANNNNTLNRNNCIAAAGANRIDPSTCYSRYPVLTADCSTASAAPITYTATAPPASAASSRGATAPTTRIPLSIPPPAPVAPPADTSSTTTGTPPPRRGGIQRGPTPGVTTNPVSNVTPGGTTPVDTTTTGAPPAPPATGLDFISTAETFLTSQAFAVGGYSIPWWAVLAAGAGAAVMVSSGGHRR